MSLPSSYLTQLRTSSGCICFVKDQTTNTYKLIRNIRWKDILNINPSVNYFQLQAYETVDGQYHTIDLEDLSIAGLFATNGVGTDINSVSKIINLGILNGSMYADECSYFLRSFQHYAYMDNCFSTGPIGFYDGSNNLNSNGICCQIAGSPNACYITNCYSTGNIYGQRSGGIAGLTFGYDGTHVIVNCYSTGDIIGDFAGGIIGDHAGFSNSTAFVIGCYSLGNVVGAEAGGITSRGAGLSSGRAILQNCYSVGRLIASGDNTANSLCLIQNCYSLDVLFEPSINYPTNIVIQNSIANAVLPFSIANLNTLNTPSSYLFGITTYATIGNSYIQDTFGDTQTYPLLLHFRSSPWRENTYNNYNDRPSNFPFEVQYRGAPFYFYTSLNPNYEIKTCDNQIVLEPPKKAKIFNKPEHKLSRIELIKWASRNKYR